MHSTVLGKINLPRKIVERYYHFTSFFEDQMIIPGIDTLIHHLRLHYSVRNKHKKYCHTIKAVAKLINMISSFDSWPCNFCYLIIIRFQPFWIYSKITNIVPDWDRDALMHYNGITSVKLTRLVTAPNLDAIIFGHKIVDIPPFVLLFHTEPPALLYH